MKNTFLVLSFFITTAAMGQVAGKSEYEKGMAASAKGKDKQANKLFDEACDKGYNEACKALMKLWYCSDYQRNEALRKCMERGDPECMYRYACTLPPDKFSQRVQLFTKAGEAGNKQASLALAGLYERNTPIHDTGIAARIYEYWASRSDTFAWCRMVMLQNNNKEALYYLATVYENKPYENRTEDEKKISSYDLYRQASKLGYGLASYTIGINEMSYGGGYNPETAKTWYDLAIKQGFQVPERDMDYVIYCLSPESKKNDAERRARESGNAGGAGQPYNKSASSSSSTQITRKTCPVCNGTGKIKDSYTSEKRDWDKKTITMTDHVTTKACSRCAGKGYYTY